VRALYALSVTHLLGFQSSSMSTTAFRLRSAASGSLDQSPSSNHFPSGVLLERIRWTASLTRSSSPYSSFARTLSPWRASTDESLRSISFSTNYPNQRTRTHIFHPVKVYSSRARRWSMIVILGLVHSILYPRDVVEELLSLDTYHETRVLSPT
jgi:hypothetical protein